MRPCRNCPHKDGCEIKAEKLRELEPFKLLWISFRCPKRLSTLPRGQRVQLTEGEPSDKDDYCDCTATVMRADRGRILVWVDGLEPGEPNPCRVSPDSVEVLEGSTELCSECGYPEGVNPTKHETNPHWCDRCCKPAAEAKPA